MRSFFTRVRFVVAMANPLSDARAARHAIDVATAHAEADGMVDAFCGRLQPPWMLRGEPALLISWRIGRNFAQRLRECVVLDAGA